MQSRVAQLNVRVLAGGDDPAQLAEAAEAFARSVLDRADAMLERYAPGRIVLVRHLACRWRLAAPSRLAAPAAVEAFAQHLVERVLACAPWTPAQAPDWSADDIAVFRDEAD